MLDNYLLPCLMRSWTASSQCPEGRNDICIASAGV